MRFIFRCSWTFSLSSQALEVVKKKKNINMTLTFMYSNVNKNRKALQLQLFVSHWTIQESMEKNKNLHERAHDAFAYETLLSINFDREIMWWKLKIILINTISNSWTLWTDILPFGYIVVVAGCCRHYSFSTFSFEYCD